MSKKPTKSPKHAPKRATSFRLNDDIHAALAKLSSRLGMSQTAIVEMAIRCLNNLDKPLTFEQRLRSALMKIGRGGGGR